MPFEEGLLLLVGEGHKGRDLREAKATHQELDLEEVPSHDHLRLAKVELGILARLVGKRDEEGTLLGALLAHVFPDGGLAAAEAMLCHQPMIDAPSSVLLLARLGFVLR